MLPLGRDRTWVFAGDSITDCGRRAHPRELGHGYVRFVNDLLLARGLDDCPTILNRGVGGDTIRDLAGRWRGDVIDQDPDVVSVKIGINDVWRQLDGKSPGVPLGEFVQTYGRLLADLIDARPDVRLVLCEPSVIGPPASHGEGNLKLLPYAMAIREIAAQFKGNVAFTVPFHGVCLEAESRRPDVEWWPDGVHPGEAGHMLLARAWLAEAGLL